MNKALPPPLRKEDIGVMSLDKIPKNKCDSLIALSMDVLNPKVKAEIQKEDSNVVDINYRNADVWIVDEYNNWVDELILECAEFANRTFKFAVTGLIERPQLMKYSAPSIGYGWHLDIGKGDSSTRKISISIILNDSSEYNGGELSFFSDGEQSFKLERGSVVAFPSFFVHRVQPIKSGVRWALVAWLSGIPFK
jgi:PKHD-type hydroxylase